MREIVSAAFVSLDGVMQAPGAPDEDRSGGFEYGGWLAPLIDDAITAAIDELLVDARYDLLLGRKTYDIFAAYWPQATKDPNPHTRDISKRFDAATKYVATHRPESLSWQNSRALGKDVVAALRELKKDNGPPLITQGSSALLQTLFEHDLVDELRLFVFPLTLGSGKRLFGPGTRPRKFEMTASTQSSRGAQIVRYRRAGDIRTGTIA